MILKKQHKLFILFLLLISTSSCFAAVGQIHAHLGFIEATYVSKQYPGKKVDGAEVLNIEYELFANSKRSNLFKSTLGLDRTSGRLVYYGSFFGSRFYLKSSGPIYEIVNQETYIKSSPKWKFFIGWDFGLSQTILSEVGDALTVISTLFDFGVHGGVAYQVTKDWAIEAKVATSYGYGFSVDPVTGMQYHGLIGFSLYFK